MSQLLLTIVVGFRDRELARVERCLGSLARQTRRDFQVIVVDYGSASEIAAQVRALTARYDFCRYVYTDTRGHPWSRSCALNVGIRLAATDYVLTTDVDMMFPPELVAAVLAQAAPERLVHAHCTFLPRSFTDWENLLSYRERLPPSATQPALGGCQCVATRILHEIGGFDEYYQYWGTEDQDLIERLLKRRLQLSYVTDRLSMFHQWHPTVDVKTEGYIPLGLWGRMRSHYLSLADEVVRNPEGWGRIRVPEARAVYRWVDLEKKTILPSETLHFFDGRPDNDKAAGKLAEVFWSLPPGHALGVHHASFPRPSHSFELLIRVTNAIARRCGSKTRIGYAPNVVHSLLIELLDVYSAMISDYYLNFQVQEGVSVVVKREV